MEVVRRSVFRVNASSNGDDEPSIALKNPFHPESFPSKGFIAP
jgi:hypothetical protein